MQQKKRIVLSSLAAVTVIGLIVVIAIVLKGGGGNGGGEASSATAGLAEKGRNNPVVPENDNSGSISPPTPSPTPLKTLAPTAMTNLLEDGQQQHLNTHANGGAHQSLNDLITDPSDLQDPDSFWYWFNLGLQSSS